MTGVFQRRSQKRGYTVVEVMAAMTLFAIGAAGVISMQRITIQGGNDARRFDVGSNIANEWLHRLQRDSMGWDRPNVSDPSAPSNIDQTRWLKIIPATDVSAWTLPDEPTATPGGRSPAFDMFGRDLIATEAPIFCVQYRLQWIANPGTAPRPGMLIRGEVRVFWARLETQQLTTCKNVDPGLAPNDYHFVYATTVIRQNPDNP